MNDRVISVTPHMMLYHHILWSIYSLVTMDRWLVTMDRWLVTMDKWLVTMDRWLVTTDRCKEIQLMAKGTTGKMSGGDWCMTTVIRGCRMNYLGRTSMDTTAVG
jgi:hypothetical protein